MSGSGALARYRPIVEDWDAFVETHGRPLPVCVWTNRLRATPDNVAALLAGEGVAAQPLAWSPEAFRLSVASGQGRLLAVLSGTCQPQEEVSMVPVRLLEPRPGERVLDLCACPGNKTAQIAVAMDGTGTVVANDVSAVRMRALRNIIERLGLVNVSTTRHDGTNYPRGAAGFDRVLVDVPCSCEGTARKNAWLERESPGDRPRVSQATQIALLRRAVRLCRLGGRVVYATCTYAPEENEAVVHRILEEPGSAVRMLPARVEGLRGSPGVTRWDGRVFHDDLRLALRLWPHQNDSGGFFVAVLEKIGGDGSAAAPGDLPADRGGEDAAVHLERGLRFVDERFGIPPGTFEGFHAFRGRRSGFYLVSRDHRPPRAPEPETSGLFFLKTSMRFPKLSTAAAMMFGRHARRNAVDLDTADARRYVAREPIVLGEEAVAGCTGVGYVVVLHQGIPLGLAFLRDPTPDGAELDSYFPKGWGPRSSLGSDPRLTQ